MIDKEQLSQQLASLPESDWYDVWEQAKTLRERVWDKRFPFTEPHVGMSRDEYASWLAGRHMAADAGIHEVLHLPAGASEDEIRLVEVNVGVDLPEEERASVFDFSAAGDGQPYRVLVADVTPTQWARIQLDPGLLPAGWSLEGMKPLGTDRT